MPLDIVSYLLGNKAGGSSAVAALDVAVKSLPEDYVGKIGDTATFTVEMASDSASYQWQYKSSGVAWTDSPAEGNKTPSLSLEISSARLALTYRCAITVGGKTFYTNEVKMIDADA